VGLVLEATQPLRQCFVEQVFLVLASGEALSNLSLRFLWDKLSGDLPRAIPGATCPGAQKTPGIAYAGPSAWG